MSAGVSRVPLVGSCVITDVLGVIGVSDGCCIVLLSGLIDIGVG